MLRVSGCSSRYYQSGAAGFDASRLNFNVSTEHQLSNSKQRRRKPTCTTTWPEFCWKNVARFFITPSKTTCGMDDANHYHVFWICPVIISYWQEIHKHINNIFGVNTPVTMDTVYMGDVNWMDGEITIKSWFKSSWLEAKKLSHYYLKLL